jgi:hypothetical protein
VYSATLIPNGTYSTVINKGLMDGDYNITTYIPYASAKAFNISNIGTASTTIISVEKWYVTTPFMILGIGGGIGIIGLLAIVFWRKIKPATSPDGKRSVAYELSEFIVISVIAFTPVAMLALTDVALFPNAPVGIIIKPSTVVKSDNVTRSIGEWMINIGGTSSDKYEAGIQIPVAIFTFGIAGGYLRYLLYKAGLTKAPETKQPSLGPPLQARRLKFDNILVDLVLLFLSPLLAIAVWLVLFQAGTTSPLTLAAVSFAVGLATQEAADALIAFVTRIFSK